MVAAAGISNTSTWGDLNLKQIKALASELCSAVFQVSGKSTFKEEFVTAGGVDLKEVNFKTFSSKVTPNLYFAGEVLNIDGITGGFNFQAAWTGGFLAGNAMAGYPLD
jgi:predicted flavoprotein YhiN